MVSTAVIDIEMFLPREDNYESFAGNYRHGYPSDEDEDEDSAYMGVTATTYYGWNGGHIPQEAMKLGAGFGTSDLKPGELYNMKVPPAYSGSESFFEYEILVKEWCEITSCDKEKRGAYLKNRLWGEAAVYKETMPPDLYQGEAGPEKLLQFLRPIFIKGATQTFLHRLLRFMNTHRGSMDLQRWIPRYQNQLQRFRAAWGDLFVLKEDADYQTRVTDHKARLRAEQITAEEEGRRHRPPSERDAERRDEFATPADT